MIGPDATVTLDFALARLTGVVERLVVYPDNMRKNLDRLGGLVHSQRVMLALTQHGVSREDSYRLRARNAGRSGAAKATSSQLLRNDAEVSARLPVSEIEKCFDLTYHFKHVDTIFVRVFGVAPA
jgi:adenylosuccinate lyase